MFVVAYHFVNGARELDPENIDSFDTRLTHCALYPIIENDTESHIFELFNGISGRTSITPVCPESGAGAIGAA